MDIGEGAVLGVVEEPASVGGATEVLPATGDIDKLEDSAVVFTGALFDPPNTPRPYSNARPRSSNPIMIPIIHQQGLQIAPLGS